MQKIKDIVLVSPPISTLERYGKFADVGSVTPPLGLCYIASVLEGAGYSVHIIDAEVLKLSMDETINKIVSYVPMVVGITSTMNTFHSAIELGRRIKELKPEIYLVLGGPYVSALKTSALDDAFDFGVYGEGEQTTLELMEFLDHGGNVSGHSTYRESNPLFDRFIRHDGIFRHNSSRPFLRAHYT